MILKDPKQLENIRNTPVNDMSSEQLHCDRNKEGMVGGVSGYC